MKTEKTEPEVTPVAEAELLAVDGEDHPIWSGTAKSDIQDFLKKLDHALDTLKKSYPEDRRDGARRIGYLSRPRHNPHLPSNEGMTRLPPAARDAIHPTPVTEESTMTPTNPMTAELAPASNDELTRIEGGVARVGGGVPPLPIEKIWHGPEHPAPVIFAFPVLTAQ